MSFFKKKYEKVKIKVDLFVKQHGKRVALTALVFFIVAVVSGGVLWWRLRTFSKDFISLPPISDPSVVDPLKQKDIDDISSKIIKPDISTNQNVVINNVDKKNESEDIAIDSEAVTVTLPAPVWQWPSENNVLKEFGVVIWPTYEDWRMHDGIDIYVEINGKIGAAASGVVSSVTWDERWGHLIEVKHGNDYISVYKGEGQVLVAVGENINAGDSIMIVEKSSLMEVVLPNHVHFMIKHKGEAIDPTTLLPTIS